MRDFGQCVGQCPLPTSSKDQLREFFGENGKRLSNYSIKMAVKVSEVSQSNRPVSRGERYQSMMAKNPALEQFKEEFGLELY